jgi:hypothetical protein
MKTRNEKMNTAQPKNSPVKKRNDADIQLAFDVGHSSIGWAAMKAPDRAAPHLLGCGVVTFEADGCLASERRGFRRQRRHIRSTRQRLSRIKTLIGHLKAIPAHRLESKHDSGGGHSAPWFLSARVMNGGRLCSWEEVWDVLRWYAHNRGYDGNRSWSRREEQTSEDTEKLQNANRVLEEFQEKHGRPGTMAEVFCDVSGLDPLGSKTSCNLPGDKRPKALNAAFPREVVEAEVLRFLQKHVGHLDHLDDAFIRCLMEDWTAIPCPGIKLPSRFGQVLPDGTRTKGGLLFGQLIPRFDNRIISRCPITFESVFQSVLADSGDTDLAKRRADKESKVPSKNCREFLRFRWAMQVANIRVAQEDATGLRPLDAGERKALDQAIPKEGYFTPSGLKQAVRGITGGAPDNLEQLLLHPDAAEALLIDPARKALARTGWGHVALELPDRLLRVLLNKLRRGALLELDSILTTHPDVATLFDEAATALANKRNQKNQQEILEEWRTEQAAAHPMSGRAPFSREVMREVDHFVFSTNRHPTEGAPGASDNGPLYRSETIREAQLRREIDEQTNNRLVRHRLLILERLHTDILREFADSDTTRVSRVTIEVNRDLRELSGKTNKAIKQELGIRLGNFKQVSEKLEKDLAAHGIRATAGLIRKARIADDLGWKCPYTGQSFDALALHSRAVDKDHIIPRSQRPSDSLDSLVITFSEVNRMKGDRTARQFIEEFAGQPVQGLPGLHVCTPQQFEDFVKSLDSRRGHPDDQRRKKKRKELLLLERYVEREFTPRDLTQTSQLVRMGAQVLERAYLSNPARPVITSLPGSVTGNIRKAWKLTACLATANPLVLNPEDPDSNGNPRPHAKTDIRGITHLHHALDACVLVFASLFLPRDGGVWELLVKRRLTPKEVDELRKRLGGMVRIAQDGSFQIADLPNFLKEQIRLRLAERRVFQHTPTRKRGLRVEQNAWRVVGIKDGEATLRQRMRQADGSRTTKHATEKISKVHGVFPQGGNGKLKKIKAGLVIRENYGLALDPEPQIIPFHKVHQRLCELTRKNGGKPPRVLRNGMLIEIIQRTGKADYRGVWKIFSLKNNSSGLAVDMGRPDVVALKNKTPGHKINVSLRTLLAAGLIVCDTGLVGIPHPNE